MTAEQLTQAENTRRIEWEATTVAAEVCGARYTIADLRKVSDRVFDPGDWKAPWAAAVPHQMVGVVMAAVEYFHGARPVTVGIEQITGRVLMRGDGYAC